MNNTYYLVRHGESKFNLEKRHQGWMNGNPLTLSGKRQATHAQKYLKDFPIDITISSPLLRAKQTARVIFPRQDIPLKTSKYLLDYRRSKKQEGLTSDQYQDLPEYELWKSQSQKDPDFALLDGESKRSFNQRISKFLNRCEKVFDQKHILIITHIDVIEEIIYKITNLRSEKTVFIIVL